MRDRAGSLITHRDIDNVVTKRVHVLNNITHNGTYMIHQVMVEDWGVIVLFMASNGYVSGRLYWYHKDNGGMPDMACLDSLYVVPFRRKMRLGTVMQTLREEVARDLGFTSISLWVERGSWQKEWYFRRGYEYWKPMEIIDPDYDKPSDWLKKTLKPL